MGKNTSSLRLATVQEDVFPELLSNCRENYIFKLQFLKKHLTEKIKLLYNSFCCVDGLSPNGKATDSDSVISRFESL